MNWRQKILDEAVEIELKKLPNSNDDTFLTIKETLSRIGIPNFKKHELYQSAHILHKKGRYYIIHFKQLFMLDGKCSDSNFSAEDKLRTIKIAMMLEQWGLCRIVSDISDEVKELAQKTKVFVLPYNEAYAFECENCGERLTEGKAEVGCDCGSSSSAKRLWTLVSKYNVGKKREF